jgi:hypothetical protein
VWWLRMPWIIVQIANCHLNSIQFCLQEEEEEDDDMGFSLFD